MSRLTLAQRISGDQSSSAGLRQRATALALSVLLCLAPAAQPCSTPCAPGSAKAEYLVPGTLHGITATTAGVTIRIVGYKTVGGNGAFCTCGLNLPLSGKILGVPAARMLFTGTTTPVPGFAAWASNAVSEAGWTAALASGTWKAFLTPATSTLPPGTFVDFEFDVIFKLPPFGGGLQGMKCVDLNSHLTGGPLEVPCAPTVPEALAILAPELASAAIGTDEATITGALTGHLTAIESFQPLIVAPPSSWVDLGHALPGSTGIVKLYGAGELGAGKSAQLILAGAKPGATFALLYGTDTLFLPFKGGVLVPEPLTGLTVSVLPTGTGTLALPFTVPSLPASFQLYFQALVVDSGAVQGIALSNALDAVFQ